MDLVNRSSHINSAMWGQALVIPRLEKTFLPRQGNQNWPPKIYFFFDINIWKLKTTKKQQIEEEHSLASSLSTLRPDMVCSFLYWRQLRGIYKQVLTPLAFLIYLLSHSFLPLEPKTAFLCLFTSLNFLALGWRCCISQIINHCSELSFTEVFSMWCVPSALVNLMPFSC